jgi:hypothetical protein
MSKNSIREPEPSPAAETEQPAEERNTRSTRNARKLIRFMNVFGVFSKDQVVKLMPFILFLSLLIVLYIANSYYAERTVRKIDHIKKELKENRAEFISVKSEMMFRSKQSEVAKAVEPLLLKEATVPPKKIIVSEAAQSK